jgi:acetyl esterase/lipase
VGAALPRVHRYGPERDQFLELTLPDGAGPAPVVVVVHGGFWRPAYGIELARPLAADLVGAGFATVAVEYRRVGEGGGWPGTLEDVAAALDSLADQPDTPRLDLGDVTAVGHSAGGHLAAWLAGRHRLPPGAPGSEPRIRLTAAVLQAGVLDLAAADHQGLGNGAVRAFLGGTPEQVPERYATADPVRLLPTGAAVLCVHGSADDVVPVDQSERYAAAAAAAGDRMELRVVPGDHMAMIDPLSPAWATARDWLTHGRAGAPYA